LLSSESFRQIGRLLHRNAITVMGSWRAWLEKGKQQRARGSERRRQTAEREKRYLRLLAFRPSQQEGLQMLGMLQWVGQWGCHPYTAEPELVM
jgi:hypothetical protein